MHQKYKKNPSLGAWVARQRLIMRQWEDKQGDGSPNRSVIAQRMKRLRDIGLDFSIGEEQIVEAF